MNNLDSVTDNLFILGSLFIVTNKLDTLLERELNEFGATTKQWFLSIVIENLFQSPPTIKQVAEAMGSSHQNVKQVAIKLEQKGLLKLEKDINDARVTRLVITEEYKCFWEKTLGKGEVFVENLFKNIDKKEVEVARDVIRKMWNNLKVMEDKK